MNLKRLGCTMIPYLFLFAANLLLHVHVHVGADSFEGFISIDCGLPSGSSYLDEKTGLNYTSDDGYIDTGENHNILPQHNGQEMFKSGLNLRSFPSGGRNCYTLSPATTSYKYLVRATFMHGDYDGKGRDLIWSPLAFDVYMGLHFWDRITVSSSTVTYVAEVIVVAEVSSLSVCLVDIGSGTPFVSSLEMRPMKSSLYPAATANQSIALQERRNPNNCHSGPVVIAALLVCTLPVFCFCRKQDTVPSVLHGFADHPRPRNQQERKGHIHESHTRVFTYEELIAITNNFSACIGEGGYGPVFHGQLNDGTHVAVKMRSPTSAIGKGMAEFLAEVGSLTTVHHRYLVLLVGYCNDKGHLALIYEYMPNGSLYDHIQGRNAIVQTLGWRDRARIALEAAQGLDYLHTGCVLPIIHIHRDLKSHNILLGHDMVAKISDFGLSKSYINVAQSHISVTAAGTLGYIDPEYCLSGRLTTSSDVFSFGVVLLEIVTGEPPIIPTRVHMVQRVKEKVTMGNIEAIVDPRLHRAYDFSSIWKVVDIALLCTREASSERPTMSMVVAQLKDALALEEARAGESISDISQVGSTADMSISSVVSAR